MMTSSNGHVFRVTGLLWQEFTGYQWIPSQRPVTRSFDVVFDLRLNKRLSKQSRSRWFEMPSCSLWRHCNGHNDWMPGGTNMLQSQHGFMQLLVAYSALSHYQNQCCPVGPLEANWNLNPIIYIHVHMYIAPKQWPFFSLNVHITLTSHEHLNQRRKSPACRLFAQHFVQPKNKENIKVPYYWPFVRVIVDSPHKGLVMWKAFPSHDVIAVFNIQVLKRAKIIKWARWATWCRKWRTRNF